MTDSPALPSKGTWGWHGRGVMTTSPLVFCRGHHWRRRQTTGWSEGLRLEGDVIKLLRWRWGWSEWGEARCWQRLMRWWWDELVGGRSNTGMAASCWQMPTVRLGVTVRRWSSTVPWRGVTAATVTWGPWRSGVLPVTATVPGRACAGRLAHSLRGDGTGRPRSGLRSRAWSGRSPVTAVGWSTGWLPLQVWGVRGHELRDWLPLPLMDLVDVVTKITAPPALDCVGALSVGTTPKQVLLVVCL